MLQDTCSPRILGRSLSAICSETAPEMPASRCADAAKMRGESLAASAVRYRRFFLLEVPGPWGSSALDESHLDAGAAARIAATTAANDLHVVLIRRPGRRPSARLSAQPSARQSAAPHPLAWAIADTSPGAEYIRWGSWSRPDDLLSLDLATIASADPGSADPASADPASADPGSADSGRGQRGVALVCTNGKRDGCCALRGRPVAAAIAAAGWDTWECSHLGGHRFAATLLLLPSGDMFGQLDPESAVEALRQFDARRLMLSNYRGRCGDPVLVQAALHVAAVRLGDCRRGAFRVSAERSGADRCEVDVTHLAGDSGQQSVYRVTLAGYRRAPALLSCADTEPKSEIHYEAVGFARLR
jgi:hypothetical protein